MANNKYKILKSIDDAKDLIKKVMEKPKGKRVIRGYQFPEGMRIVGKHIKFIGCKMHKVSADRGDTNDVKRFQHISENIIICK